MRPHITQAIMGHAKAEYPKECCGLVIQHGRKQQYIRCRNSAPLPTEQFSIHPEDYAEAEDIGTIIAIVHSHPDATTQPSQLDIAQCDLSQVPWVIVSWPEGDIRTIMPTEGIKPLLGRPFVHGIWDCYAIVRDWYRLERDIDIPDFERSDGWWERGENLYMKNYADAGFTECRGELQVGDVIIMQVQSSEPNHAGVYIGDGLMLHHMYGQLSHRVPYSGYWQDRTIITLRHMNPPASAGFFCRSNFMNTLRTIRLSGVLIPQFGREYKLAVSSPIEAIRALSVLIDGFEKFLLTAKERGLTFAVFIGKRNINRDELELSGEGDIRIVPVIIGSKKAGIFQTILGAVMVVAGAFIGGPFGAPMVMSGVGMMLGGVVQMLSPMPGGLARREDPDNKPSYAFGGPVNSIAQGNPVPIGYGRRRIGGAIISAGIYAEDQQ